jgi:hypothetical protein
MSVALATRANDKITGTTHVVSAYISDGMLRIEQDADNICINVEHDAPGFVKALSHLLHFHKEQE